MDYTDLVKKVFYMAVGYATVNQEKIEEFTNELMEKGKMTEEEGKKFIDDMIEKSKSVKDDLSKKVEEMSKEAFDTLHIASTEEMASLKERVEKLEAEVAKLSKAK